MKKQSGIFHVLRISLTLLIITSVVAALLAGVNSITAQKIADMEKEKTQKAIAEVLPGETIFYDMVVDSRSFQLWLQETGRELPAIVTGGKDSWDKRRTDCIPLIYTPPVRTGYAIEVRPTGFDGEITMMVGIDLEGRVVGISIISHTETAGLGAVAGADTEKGRSFRGQFVGQSGELAVTKDGGTVDAISGATITSRAVTEGVNAALEYVAIYEEFFARSEQWTSE